MRITKKYAQDYKVYAEETVRGKLRTRAAYVGARYRLKTDGRTFLLQLALPTVLAAIFWLLPMLPVSGLAQNPISCIPFVLAIIPICLSILALSPLYRSLSEKNTAMKRQDKDTAETRIKGGAFMTAVFLGVSLIASLVLLIIGEVSPIGIFDVLMLLCAALGTALSLFIYIRARRLEFHEIAPVPFSYGEE